MKKIVIAGAGGLGREILALIHSINNVSHEWEVVGFIDDSRQPGDLINGQRVMGKIEYLDTINEETFVALAFGNPEIREAIGKRISNKLIKFPVLIHPSAILMDRENISIGNGTIIAANCVLSSGIKLGSHVFLNVATTLSHDTTVGPYSTLMPGVRVSSGAEIDKSCYIGTGSIIHSPIHIQAGTCVPAGSVLG